MRMVERNEVEGSGGGQDTDIGKGRNRGGWVRRGMWQRLDERAVLRSEISIGPVVWELRGSFLCRKYKYKTRVGGCHLTHSPVPVVQQLLLLHDSTSTHRPFCLPRRSLYELLLLP